MGLGFTTGLGFGITNHEMDLDQSTFFLGTRGFFVYFYQNGCHCLDLRSEFLVKLELDNEKNTPRYDPDTDSDVSVFSKLREQCKLLLIIITLENIKFLLPQSIKVIQLKSFVSFCWSMLLAICVTISLCQFKITV